MAKKNIIIASNGDCTQIFVDGKVYGNHIEEFTFCHVGGDEPQMNIKASALPVEGDLSLEGFEQMLSSLLGKKNLCETAKDFQDEKTPEKSFDISLLIAGKPI